MTGGVTLAKPNFKFEKRQKELARMKKAEEKRLRKRGLLDENKDAVTDPATDPATDPVTDPVTDQEAEAPLVDANEVSDELPK